MKILKQLLKKLMKRESALYQLLKAWYRFGLLKPVITKDLSGVLNAYNRYKTGKVFFIQIGSNDGLYGDPLHEFIIQNNWSGILVEPLPELFTRLKQNYEPQKERLYFENVAVSGKTGSLAFYYIDNNDNSLPGWTSQLSSFNKDVILKHTAYNQAIADRIREIILQTDSFDNILLRNELKTVDLIHIDTEGHDFEILKAIDLEKYKPDIIIYEQKHLSKSDARKSVAILRKKEYRVRLCKSDCIAVHKTIKLKQAR